MTAAKKILIIAGEASGDLHGANLVKELKGLDPSLEIFGVGSKRMREAGVELLADAAEISVVGATEVLTHLGAIWRVYDRLKRFIRTERPDLLILIDFPDFNILVGKVAKKLGIPVLYYISPQVWAWRKGRIKTLAKLVKAMMVLFPFEVDLYRRAGVDVRFVGHPLVDAVDSRFTCTEARMHFRIDQEQMTVALLPGSRTKEITSLLPDMLVAAGILKDRFPRIQFLLPVAPTLEMSFVKGFVDRSGLSVTVVNGAQYDVLRASDAAIVASGTATLETGLMAVPMVIVYRISKLSYFIGKMIVDVKNIGLVNIVAGKTVVPELVQDQVSPEAIAAAIGDMLADPQRHAAVKSELEQVRILLGERGATGKAAAVVREFLHAGS